MAFIDADLHNLETYNGTYEAIGTLNLVCCFITLSLALLIFLLDWYLFFLRTGR